MKTKLFFWLFLLTLPSGYCQSWQWAKEGGGTDALATMGKEGVKSMSVDSNGNVAMTSFVGRINLQVDGHPQTTYASNAFNDAILTTFSCDGSYKWSKVFGGYYGFETIYTGTDAQGNVYAVGHFPPSATNLTPVHLGTDVVLPVSNNNVNTFKQSLFLIKYDKDGNYLWHRLPQPPDVTRSISYTYTTTFGLQIDAQGNSYWLCLLPQGVYADGQYAVTTPGMYVLKYDTNGTFIGAVDLDMQTNDSGVKMRLDEHSGRIYIVGEHYIDNFGGTTTIIIHGQPITHSKYLAAFDGSGALLWLKENEGFSNWGGGAAQCESLAFDSQNNIYFAGSTGPVSTTNSNPDSFNGVAFVTSGAAPWPFIVKLDPQGNTLWQTNGGQGPLQDVVVNGDEVAVTGSARILHWQSVDYMQDTNSGGHPYLARFNKDTGNIIAIGAVYTTGNDIGTAIGIDGHGSYYVGGSFGASLTAGNTVNSTGGGGDFFVAKFGTADCSLGSESFEKKTINVYPNPVKGLLHVDGLKGDYVVYDVRGVVIKTGTVGSEATIDFDGVASGVYLLKVGGGVVKVVVD